MQIPLKIFVLMGLVIGLAGCGETPKVPNFKVTGVILSKGSPITGLPPGEKAQVVFTSEQTKAQSYARVMEDGSFSVDLAKGNYSVTGSAGFTADPNKKGPGMVTRALKVETDIKDLVLDISKK